MRCQKIYSEAASATARSAVILSGLTSAPPHMSPPLESDDADSTPLTRERATFVKDAQVRHVYYYSFVYSQDSQTDDLIQHLAIKLPRVGDETFRRFLTSNS